MRTAALSTLQIGKLRLGEGKIGKGTAGIQAEASAPLNRVTKLLTDIKTSQPQSPETTTEDTTKGRGLDEEKIRERKLGNTDWVLFIDYKCGCVLSNSQKKKKGNVS